MKPFCSSMPATSAATTTASSAVGVVDAGLLVDLADARGVEREVHEETGIRIKNLRYFDSQPWPYPFGLMVGFTADYDSGELLLQKAELSEGGWFTRDMMPSIPDRASIARRLIDDWLAHGK